MTEPTSHGQTPITNPRTLAQMLPPGKYSVREMMSSLRMASHTIKASIENPSRLSLGDVFRLAKLLNEPVAHVLAELVAEVKALPPDKHPAPGDRPATGQ